MKWEDLPPEMIREAERPYQAVNGHVMINRYMSTPGGNAYRSSANAYCVPDCPACEEGYQLEDW